MQFIPFSFEGVAGRSPCGFSLPFMKWDYRTMDGTAGFANFYLINQFFRSLYFQSQILDD
ncbi:hypothetical protein [Egbenema bharatensis]|uniref:hypothetical protein n=1 Tax=Egbenema bharatensis TaxID=3463334 RepID=UPI003A84140B